MDELYVLARRVLLDALDAIGTHRDAIVLAGAQAVYLRVGEADLAVAPFTTDGDIAIDPAALAEIPPLELALGSAGFHLKEKDSVGVWVTHRVTSGSPETEVGVDLLVPASVSPGKGRRAARLRGHDKHAARIVQGLDGVLVDNDVMRLASLETGDQRAFDIRVAGAAALLIAKVHKIQDRRESSRASDKDALDVLRLLRGTSTEDLAARYRRVLDDERSRAPAINAAELLRRQFADRRGVGVEMMLRAVGPLADHETIAVSCVALSEDLLAAVE